MKHNAFSKVIAFVLCLVMVMGLMTSCFQDTKPQNEVITPEGEDLEVTTPSTTRPEATTTKPVEDATTTTTPTTTQPEEDVTTTTPPATTQPEEDVTTTTPPATTQPDVTEPTPDENETTTTTQPEENEDPKEDSNELFSVSTTVEPDAENKVPEGGVNMSGESASATIPGGVQMEEGATELSLVVSAVADSEATIELLENEVSTSLDVHIAGVAQGNLVPMEIKLLAATSTGLNSTSIKLYHVENGETVEMTRVANDEAFTAHNQFKYDPATGDITLYIASFSEIAVVSNTVNAWTGNADHTWYNAEATELYIANAEQLWSFSQIVGGMAEGIEQDSFSGKTVTLLADINLGDDEANNDENKIFYPIGYWNNEGTYERKPLEERETAVSSGFYSFCGTFDGNGHTIENFYQNTWEMKGDHNWYDPIKEQYYRDGMGLFGKVYGGTVKNLTVKNFTSDGEITTTGVIAAYADCGATFENIAIFNCNPRVYNIGNGGIVGCVGWYSETGITGETTEEEKEKLTVKFTNITVDNSNKISALWGSYDVACGGIVGQYYPTSGQSSASYPVNAGIHFENCHVSAQMDVYNDVCANYQYYAYRYTGMLIGSVRENETKDGHVYPNMKGITASGCTVNFGSWNDYYYCELVANSLASYTHDHQMSRLVQVASVDLNTNTVTTLDGKTVDIPKTGRANYVVVNGDHATENATCYHFVDGNVWNHKDAGEETVDGSVVLKEDKQHIYLEFNNLVTGYGWGVTSKGITDFKNVEIDKGQYESSVEKFNGVANNSTLTNFTTYTFAELFKLKENIDVELVQSAIAVGVTNLDENGNVKATITYNRTNWANSTITFTGTGTVQITIQDYYFCTPTTITVQITDHEHNFGGDNKCECGAVRIIVTETTTTENNITFELGTDGSATHKDGSTDKTTYKETNGDCTLNLTNGSKMYPSSYDANGNSCIKLGTSSVVGTFKFAVPDDVNKVIIGIAKYKANTSKVNVNDTEYTLTKNSDNGEYDAIEVDTTTNKTVTLATVSGGVRAMVNYITFVVTTTTTTEKSIIIPAHDCNENVLIEGKDATCTEAGLTNGAKCDRCGTITLEQQIIDALGHSEETIAGDDATCTENGLTEGKQCSVCGTVTVQQTIVEALGHEYNNENKYICSRENCGHIELPVNGSTITIQQALWIAETLENGKETSGKYTFTCVIDDEDDPSTTGTTYVTCNGKPIKITEISNVDGTIGYENFKTKIKHGDEITVSAKIAKNDSGDIQLKETRIAQHTDLNPIDHTCDMCGKENVTNHVDTDGDLKCDNGCDVQFEAGSNKSTVAVNIGNYANEHSWSNSTRYTSITVDSNINVTVTGGGNTGKYYTSENNWRIYQNESPAITITSTSGKIISVKITYTTDNTGVLTFNGSNITSNTVVDVNANSITFGVGNTGSATNGQVRITEIQVVYQTTGSEGGDQGGETTCKHTNTTKTTVDATCTTAGSTTVTCDDCGTTVSTTEIPMIEHTYVDGACSACGAEDPDYEGGSTIQPETLTADFNTITANTSYNKKTTTSGWIGENCASVKVGTEMSLIMNGKTSANGTITSPTLKNGVKTITFSYTNTYKESNGVDITIQVIQNDTVVDSYKLDDNSVTQDTVETYTWNLTTPITGDFTIKFINNSPSNSTSNKDRVSILNVQWTTNPQ